MKVIIIGGGTAGITVAASLRKRTDKQNIEIKIIEPSEHHYYQPAFTLVGGGAYSLDKTRKKTEALIPSGVELIKDEVTKINPEEKVLSLNSGKTIEYDYLIVAAGLALDWDKVKGLKEAAGKNGVCTNYSPDHVEYTYKVIKSLKEGQKILFTQPPMPFKCAGAPQKIAYLCADHLF
jgi:sulfide:quinone oxidoreductase